MQDTIQKEIYTFQGKTLRVGIVGLVHMHVHWILGRENNLLVMQILEAAKHSAKQEKPLVGRNIFNEMNE